MKTGLAPLAERATQTLLRPLARGPSLFLAGFLIAILGALCGIGGGLFAVPLLYYGARLPLRQAVATSLCLVVATTATATVAEALRPDERLYWPLVGFVALGALVGTQTGYAVAQRIPLRQLRMVFTVVLFAAGFRILTAQGSENASADLATFALHPKSVAAGLAIGFGGGFLAPLLGVGGGLIMVPGLFLLLPEIGYLGARATSLAVGAVSAGRSLLLYARVHLVDARAGGYLAAGGLVGAGFGVSLVHRPGWTEYAQVVMGLILVFVALRFLIEVMRQTPEGT